MNILLTGSRGFVAQNIYRELNELGHDVYAIEKENTWKDVLAFIRECDVVMHQGAISDTMNYDINEMMTENFEFSRKLFDACSDKKIIYASSAACYDLTSPYAWSKYCAEVYGLAACDDFVALRYFNVYGPGENHKGKMASVAHQAMNRNHMRLFPERPTRDFVYIDDVVSANIHAMENTIRGVYDVGTGQSRSFEDVCDILGVPFDYADSSNIPTHYQYHTKADYRNWMPGWYPKWNLEAGLIEYMRVENENLD